MNWSMNITWMTSFIQSQSVAIQNQSNRKITFDTQPNATLIIIIIIIIIIVKAF